jgi:chromosome segregation ATPase
LGLATILRNAIGAAPKSEVDLAQAVAASAADARRAAELMRGLADEARADHAALLAATRDELARLSARVDAMPEMRAQLESFVGSLGRTMHGAAERLESVDDRMERLEQSARSQTEILAISRGELDRQGRLLSSLDAQAKSLEAAVARLTDATSATESLVREFEGRKVRLARAAWTAVAAATIAVAAALVAVVALLR